MSQPELLKRVVQTLDELRIDYMITGSIASSLDLDYLNRWADTLGLRDLWTRLQNEADVI